MTRSVLEPKGWILFRTHTNLMLNLVVDAGTFSQGMRSVPSLAGGAGSLLSRDIQIIQVWN